MSDARFEAFPRRDGNLYAEDVPIDDIIEQVGSPAYVYSAGALRSAYNEMAAAFAGQRHPAHRHAHGA